MKARVLVALGVGYVVGARAGRGRYRQIVSAAERAADALERFAGGAGQGAERVASSASPGRSRVGDSGGDAQAEDEQGLDGDVDEGAAATSRRSGRRSAQDRNGDDLLDFDRLLTRGRPFDHAHGR